MTNFEDLKIPDFLVDSLKKMKITAPTPIQAAAILPALAGSDILASAQTGSGKTLAFMLPLIINLYMNPLQRGLILLPTRELAQQVITTFIQLRGRTLDLHAAVIIGGEPMGKQFHDLKRNPRLIIGTPGRICDHLNRGSLDLSKTHFLVLDEMDRMLDMGFHDDLEIIRGHLPEKKQVFMFSATLPPRIEKVSMKYLNSPERIAVGSALTAAKEVEQSSIQLPRAQKFDQLLEEIKIREGSILVFVRTKRSADELAYQLRELDHAADAIHGDLNQRKRERAIQGFRSQRSRIMVATDIAARGLDVPHIQHVINYDLPECPSDYVHRIGRTGRAGAKGFSLSFISPDERSKWREIHEFMNPDEARSKSGSRGGYERREGSSRSAPRGRSSFGPRREGMGFGAPRSERSSERFGERSSERFGERAPGRFGERAHSSDEGRRSDFRRSESVGQYGYPREGGPSKKYGSSFSRSGAGRRGDSPRFSGGRNSVENA